MSVHVAPSPDTVRLDDGSIVRVMPSRVGACWSEVTTEHGEEWECWREAGHDGPHVQPAFDWLGRVEQHRSPMWIW